MDYSTCYAHNKRGMHIISMRKFFPVKALRLGLSSAITVPVRFIQKQQHHLLSWWLLIKGNTTTITFTTAQLLHSPVLNGSVEN